MGLLPRKEDLHLFKVNITHKLKFKKSHFSLIIKANTKGIVNYRLAKIPTLYHHWLRSLNEENEQLFELQRREGWFERHSLNCIE